MPVPVARAAAPAVIGDPTHHPQAWEVVLIRAVGTLRGDLAVTAGAVEESMAAAISTRAAAEVDPGTAAGRLVGAEGSMPAVRVAADREGSVWAWDRMVG